LTHRHVVEFSKSYGVSLAWLLEGQGPMTGEEFAAQVAELPISDQQAIRTMIREILSEKLDETPPSIA
jgi:hypothetical protein